MKRLNQRLLREPFVHFLAIGALLFLIYASLNDSAEPPANVIQVGPEKIAQIEALFREVWNRKPTEKELSALIEEDIREEVYYREALALGLDRNDALVRRRLRLKMEFLIDSAASALTPTQADLETFYSQNKENYQLDPRLAFEQIFLGDTPDPNASKEALAQLQQDPTVDVASLGVRSLLPAQFGLSLKQTVNGTFGSGFFEQLESLTPGQWSGPVVSSYGQHFVRILDHLPRRVPDLNEVRTTVEWDWRRDKTQEIHDLDYAERRKRFEVEISPYDPVETDKP